MDLRVKAAGFILQNDNMEEALRLLDNAEGSIPDEVQVLHKFDYEPLESLIEYIDDLEKMLKEVWDAARSER